MKQPALLAAFAAAVLPAVFSCSSGQGLRDIDACILGLVDRYGLPPQEQRARMAEDVLALAPAAEPGTAYMYSNFGYVVAGLMLETAAQSTLGEMIAWEDMIQELLFAPSP